MHNASKMLYSNWNGLFQTAMFSIAGFSASMMLTMVGGFRAVYPWF
jgi:predicted exporter